MGGVGEPERPHIADVGGKVAFPPGQQGRPPKQFNYIAGYAGFRPINTPLASLDAQNKK